ncbi:FAD/NAD(P)-binding protein [Fodinicola feengrottensis]|uniref:FAD/NAD(P)-binding protein n=1 Tax=Fodinicola feengrottensis TaxID=435914 RepID=A0ABN2GP73_9ACTN
MVDSNNPESDAGLFTVAVIGAGAAGTLATARLLAESAASGRRISVALINSGADVGRGPAYSTMCDAHLLNVPAGKMGADPENATGFMDWMSDRGRPVAATDFLPRWLFGSYLGEHLSAAARRYSKTGSVRFLRARAIGISDLQDGVAVHLADGRTVRAGGVVLALGGFGPSREWVPAELAGSAHLINDPWDVDALDSVPSHADLLLVGTGLTMCDVALASCRPGRTVYAVSRSGLLPHPHVMPLVSPLEMPLPVGASSLRDVRQVVLRHVVRSVRATGDWRPAMDGLRPLTTKLWQRLSDRDRADFLVRYQRVWESHRHRIPPPTSAALAGAVDSGELEVNAAEIVQARPERGRVRVWLSNGRKLEVAAVVNCAGPEYDLNKVDDRLIRHLLATGLARCGPQLLGLDTTDDGRLVGADRHRRVPLWTIGSLRRGNLWETTAIPEIRGQASQLARTVLGCI